MLEGLIFWPWRGGLTTVILLAVTLGLAGCAFDGTALEQVACTDSSDCEEGFSCIAGRCVAGDVSVADTSGGQDTFTDDVERDDGPTGFACGDAFCGDTELCCGQSCVDIQTDSSNCGACNVACSPGESCIDGACTCGDATCGPQDRCCSQTGGVSCVNVSSDSTNCGGCGNVCDSSELCVNSLCVCEGTGGALEQCTTAQVCCNLAGCRDLDTDPNHCGACGVACGAGEICVDGACTCGATAGAPATGAICGSTEACCGTPQQCVDATDPVCDCNGAECATGQLCCSVQTGNADVEACVYVDQDKSHCGACGASCGPAQVCTGSQCECESGYADCDSNPANGCEVRLDSDSEHCSACNAACASGEVCNGNSQCALTCQSGLVECDGVCVNPDTDRAWCGARSPCSSVGQRGAVCDEGFVCDGSGVCALSCQSGLVNCDGTCIDPRTDRTFCGATGACTGATRGQSCSDGFVCNGATNPQCALSCQGGLQICDNTCVDVQSNPAHCGSCNAGCSDNELCESGGCVCKAGFADCDGDPSNGCEINLNTDESHCGACTRVCSSNGGTGTCTAGACNLSCSSGRLDCDGNDANGCEINRNTATADCGACGNDCRLQPNVASGGTCSTGICGSFTCASGWTDCTPGEAGCDTFTDGDVANCGACNNDCNAKSNVDTAACDGAVCKVLICDAGRFDCDGDGDNGCESTSPCASCNNNARENNEPCDGTDLGGLDCTDFGYDSGTLACNAGCTDFVFSSCAYDCGDGSIDPGETCDDNNTVAGTDDALNGLDCTDVGFDAGTLACNSSCNGYVTTSCSTSCGNGSASGSEVCDDNNTTVAGDDDLKGVTCSDVGFDGGTLECNTTCNGYDTSACTFACGNGTATGGELCDNNSTAGTPGDDDLLGVDCTDLGYDAGTLECDANCSGYITTACSFSCGNGTASGNEVCDDNNTTIPGDDDLQGVTCADVGFDGGTLECNTTCNGYDTSACTTTCGNGTASGGETCDNAGTAGTPGDDDLLGVSCTALGFDGGTLECNGSCNGYDTSGCTYSCGNGTASGGETCDNGGTAGTPGDDDLLGVDCTDLGFDSGTLECNASCDGYVTTSCTTSCGNGTASGGETCDNNSTAGTPGDDDLLGVDCTDLGFDSGTLECNASCNGYITTACAYTCASGFKDCDAGVAGCETFINGDPANCGDCNTVCPAVTDAAPVCVPDGGGAGMGSCSYVCDSGRADCNLSSTDGCEVNTQTDANNCGGCGTVCDSGVCISGECAKLIFVSTAAINADIGSVAAADTQCGTWAGAGTAIPSSATSFKAWISDGTTSPDTSFTKHTGPYVLTDGTVVADDYTELTSGTLQVAITQDEDGATVTGSGTSDGTLCGATTVAWTNVDADGTAPTITVDCTAWSDGTGSGVGAQGDFSQTDSDWTAYCTTSKCNDSGHLICVQQ